MFIKILLSFFILYYYLCYFINVSDFNYVTHVI
jgi:hypothetical protein